jgi:hypothetical protein
MVGEHVIVTKKDPRVTGGLSYSYAIRKLLSALFLRAGVGAVRRTSFNRMGLFRRFVLAFTGYGCGAERHQANKCHVHQCFHCEYFFCEK